MKHPIKSKRRLKVYKVTRKTPPDWSPYGSFMDVGDEFTITDDWEDVTVWQVARDVVSIVREWLTK